MTRQWTGWTVKRTRTDGYGRPLNRVGTPIHISAVAPEYWGNHVAWEDADGNDHPGFLYRAERKEPVEPDDPPEDWETVYQYRYQGTNWHPVFWDAFTRWWCHHSWMPH